MRPSRRLQVVIATGLGALFAAASTASALESGAPAPATETSAQSQAVLARLVPYVGLPGVTTSVGLATAQVSSGVARSSAAAADFGLIGMLAGAGTGSVPEIPGAPPVSLPSPISADSEGTNRVDRDPFAMSGAPAAPGADPSAPTGLLAHETATADPDPLGARGLVNGPMLRVPGLIEVSGGIADAAAGGAGGALSLVTLDRLDLGAGQVVLEGLRWSASQKPAAVATSGFTVRGMTIAGQAMPVDSPAQLAESLRQASTALAPLGLSLSAPEGIATPTGASVAPLVIQVRNPDALVEPSRQVSSTLAPVITDLIKAATAGNEDAAAAQIVTNAVVGGAGGRSGGRIELGGVNARASLVNLEALAAPLAETPDVPLPMTVPPLPAASDTPVLLGPEPTVSTADGPSALVPTTETTTLAQNPAAAVIGKDTKRVAAAVGLGVILAVILALAVGDRIRIAAAGAR